VSFVVDFFLYTLFRRTQAQTRVLPIQQPVRRNFVPWVEFGKCPDCGTADKWQAGPGAGMCTNFTCGACGSKFNVAGSPIREIQRIG